MISFFALFFYALAAIGLYGLWLLSQTDDASKSGESMWTLIASVFLGITLGTILIKIGWRIFKRMDHKNFDSNDPDEPMMKF